jgi:hypothetical protein
MGLYRRVDKRNSVSYIKCGFMEEKENPTEENLPQEERPKEVDLNSLFPGKGFDLNKLFPDEESRRLLRDVKRNRRDIERFLKNLDMEEE